MTNTAKTVMTVSRAEYERITSLADKMSNRMPEVAETMLSELDRSIIIEDADVLVDVVQMGSEVVYDVDGERKTVVLAFPGEADIALGKISVMTPLGVALFGAQGGQTVSWLSRDGRANSASIIEVRAEMRPAMMMA